MGAKEVRAARAALAATIANEVTQNGGKPVGADNPHYSAAKKRVDDALEEMDRPFRWWEDA